MTTTVNWDTIVRLREALANEPDVIARIGMYNDPANGSFIERLLATTEYDEEDMDDAQA